MANKETVLNVTHYTDDLMHFTLTRDLSTRFRDGEFLMIGLDNWSEKLQKNKSEEFSWRANFSVEWFLSIKNDGLISPLFKLQDNTDIFNRGSHRAWILGKLGYGFPIFVPRFNDKLTLKICTSWYKWGSDVFLEIDYINKELNVYDRASEKK